MTSIQVDYLQEPGMAAYIAGVPENVVDAALASGVLASSYDPLTDQVLVSVPDVAALGGF